MLGCSSLERHEDRVERLEIEQQELNPALEPCHLGADCLMLAGYGRRSHKSANTANVDELSFRAYVALAGARIARASVQIPPLGPIHCVF